MNKRLLFIIYISYFVGLVLCVQWLKLVGIREVKNRSSVARRELSELNPTSNVVAVIIISFVCPLESDTTK